MKDKSYPPPCRNYLLPLYLSVTLYACAQRDNVGSRRAENFHARLRMRCTSLKQHLFLRNIEPDPYCTNCNLHQVESIEHYLLKCPKYSNQRTDLINSLNTVVQHVPVTCQLLLYGNETESYDHNRHIFSCVQSFILKTKRFT